jgi:hypothetical protein
MDRMMKSRVLVFSLFVTAIVVTLNVHAGVYRWVDENGRVQFGDRPPPEATTSDEVIIRNKAPAPGEAAPVDRKEARERLLEQYQREREEKKEVAAKKRKQKEQRAANCNFAKSRLNEYLESGALYRRTPNQEREYLSDQEREAAIAGARADVKKWCN